MEHLPIESPLVQSYSTFTVDPEVYRNRTVLVMGLGNSGNEVAEREWGWHIAGDGREAAFTLLELNKDQAF